MVVQSMWFGTQDMNCHLSGYPVSFEILGKLLSSPAPTPHRVTLRSNLAKHWALGWHQERRAFHITAVVMPVIINAINTLPGPPKMRFLEPSSFHMITLRQSVPHRFLGRLLWFQKMWSFWTILLQFSVQEVSTSVFVRQQSKKPACRDSIPEIAWKRGKREYIFQKAFLFSGEPCVITGHSPHLAQAFSSLH